MARQYYIKLHGPLGATLTLDRSRLDPDDPGADTPALVEWRKYAGTYQGCSETGDIGDRLLPTVIVEWLNSDAVTKAVDALYE